MKNENIEKLSPIHLYLMLFKLNNKNVKQNKKNVVIIKIVIQIKSYNFKITKIYIKDIKKYKKKKEIREQIV